MKRIFIIIAAAVSLMSCQKNKENEWMGTYKSDSVTIEFKEKGQCEVTTKSGKMTGDYSWDVDSTSICVVDAEQNIYLLNVHDGYMTTADTNQKFNKIK